MKNFKIYLLTFVIALVSLSSCRTDDSVEELTLKAEESVALRIALNKFNEYENISNDVFFDFEYPVQLEYNNTSSVKVESFEGLLSLIEKENQNLHIAAVDMPFKVLIDGVKESVTSEDEFIDVLDRTGVYTPGENNFFFDCFTFVFPIQVVTIDGTIYDINSEVEFNTFIENHIQEWAFEFVYPFSVTLEDGTVEVIENEFELFELIFDCLWCGCDPIYEPVCVEVDGMIIEYPNICEAECAGYTQNDIVDCNNANDCNITNLTAVPGDCNNNGTTSYPLTIDFEYENNTSDSFVVLADNVEFGTYSLSELPLTIPEFIGYGLVSVYIVDAINPNNVSCWSQTQFDDPECGGNSSDCNITNLTAVPGDCNNNGTPSYSLTLDFDYENNMSDSFVVLSDGVEFGTYSLSELPLTIPEFIGYGQLDVYIIDDNDPSNSSCWAQTQYTAPDCGDCSITNFTALPGDCNNNGTNSYPLMIDFDYENNTSDSFVVLSDGFEFGTYLLSELPLTIPEFIGDGLINVFIIDYLNPGNYTCSAQTQFNAPNCGSSGNDCFITDLTAISGDCNNNGTTSFPFTIDFYYENNTSDLFVVIADGVEYGTYSLSELPLTIPEFVGYGLVSVFIMDDNDPGNTSCWLQTQYDAPNCD